MGKQWKQCQTLFWGGSKITADGACNHEINRCLLLWRKVMTNIDSIFKSRDLTLPTKVRLVKAMVFPVVMYGCESWIVKKAECRRVDALELRSWRRLLRVLWTARRFNQSILKGISLGVLLRNDSKAVTLVFWPAHVEIWLTGKESDAGTDWGHEEKCWGRDGWMASPTRWTWIWVKSESRWWTERPGVLWFMLSQRVGHEWVTELNWMKPK